MLISENIYELFPRRKYFGDIGEILCKNEAATHDFCTAAMFLVTGFDYVQFNSVSCNIYETVFLIKGFVFRVCFLLFLRYIQRVLQLKLLFTYTKC